MGRKGTLLVSLMSFLACTTELDLPAPLGLEHLRGGDAARRVRIEDGVDDVATARLW